MQLPRIYAESKGDTRRAEPCFEVRSLVDDNRQLCAGQMGSRMENGMENGSDSGAPRYNLACMPFTFSILPPADSVLFLARAVSHDPPGRARAGDVRVLLQSLQTSGGNEQEGQARALS